MWHRFGQGFREVILCAVKRSEAESARALSTGHLLWSPQEQTERPAAQMLAMGHENTARLLGSGLLALLRHPAQWQKLCADPDAHVEAAVEELLRYDSSVQWTIRHIREDMEWQGHSLKQGQRVQIGIGPANHDPAQFPQASQFDITCAPNRHVAFGHGRHFCLGAALTRLEAQTVFRCLAARFPRLRLAQPPRWRQEGLAFCGLQALHVCWQEAGR